MDSSRIKDEQVGVRKNYNILSFWLEYEEDYDDQDYIEEEIEGSEGKDTLSSPTSSKFL